MTASEIRILESTVLDALNRDDNGRLTNVLKAHLRKQHKIYHIRFVHSFFKSLQYEGKDTELK